MQKKPATISSFSSEYGRQMIGSSKVVKINCTRFNIIRLQFCFWSSQKLFLNDEIFILLLWLLLKSLCFLIILKCFFPQEHSLPILAVMKFLYFIYTKNASNFFSNDDDKLAECFLAQKSIFLLAIYKIQIFTFRL